MDYGFANYEVVSSENLYLPLLPIAVRGGTEICVLPKLNDLSFIVKKGNRDKVETSINLPDMVSAPIREGEVLGEVTFTIDGQEVAKREICAATEITRIHPFAMYLRVLTKWLTL